MVLSTLCISFRKQLAVFISQLEQSYVMQPNGLLSMPHTSHPCHLTIPQGVQNSPLIGSKLMIAMSLLSLIHFLYLKDVTSTDIFTVVI